MRLVVTGGGTGGHIYPALAVANVMKADPSVESVVYIGKTGGLESELVPQAGVPFEGIFFYGMPRRRSFLLPFQLVRWFAQLQVAKMAAKKLLQVHRPHVVFGTGGYVSAPVLMAAKSLGIPYVVHEPDAQPGLVNRLMSRHARIITTSFSEGAEKLRHHDGQEVLVTGNPIRDGIGVLSKQKALLRLGRPWPEEQPVLLVTGGSQGARRINQAVVDALPGLVNELGFAVVHLTGRALYEETCQAVKSRQPAFQDHSQYWMQPYSADMDALLALAEIAVCRAGSLSLSEMYVCGIPTVLVPYPHAASDHQRKNAQASVRLGASCMIEDADCRGSALLDVLRPLMLNAAQRQAMRAAARQLGHPHATAEIVACLQRFSTGTR